jgi:hypothetical protein
MYIDESVFDTVLKKNNPNAKWTSPKHRDKVVSLVLYNRRVEDVQTLEKVIASVNSIPYNVLDDVTWIELQQAYGCPKIW